MADRRAVILISVCPIKPSPLQEPMLTTLVGRLVQPYARSTGWTWRPAGRGDRLDVATGWTWRPAGRDDRLAGVALRSDRVDLAQLQPPAALLLRLLGLWLLSAGLV